MDDSSPPEPTGDGHYERLSLPGSEFSPLDALVALVRERGLFVLVAGGVVLLGTAYALAAPSRYTATSTVVREAQSEPEGIPSTLPSIPGLNIDPGNAGRTGLAPSAYPNLLTSREVRLAVARDTFYFPETGRRTTFVKHVNQSPGAVELLIDYTVRLPWTLMEGLGRLFRDADRRLGASGARSPLLAPSEEEQRALDALEKKVSASTQGTGALGGESGLMVVSTTAADPTLAARLNASFIEHLRRRVREIRTQNTMEHLKFVRQRLAEAGRELERAEDSLAQFLERNRSVIAGGGAPTLSFRRDRLQRQVRFKEQLYGQLQKKLTQTRLRLQRQQPVITVAEQPTPPPEPSAPNRSLIIVLSVLLGGAAGAAAVYFRSVLASAEAQESGREKLEEIRGSLTAEEIVQGVREELGRT
ncbi:MAG: GNVR domain-containing protein [Salinibacter sp.]|uniref:GNVR domain-containing protein n=1 Tax=Salinibacter sp. TaxID=2065818 RepID=UPI0035D518A2